MDLNEQYNVLDLERPKVKPAAPQPPAAKETPDKPHASSRQKFKKSRSAEAEAAPGKL